MPKHWNVTAQSFNRKTGKSAAPQRVEQVDTNNFLFKDCDSILEVKEAYEHFWNDMDNESIDIVFVAQVKPII